MGSTKPGPTPYLSQVEEKELTDYLLIAAKSGFGRTCKDVMNIVERYVNQNSSHTVSIINGWWCKFKKRSPCLSLRSGDSTASVRMSAVNKDNINHEHNFRCILRLNSRSLN